MESKRAWKSIGFILFILVLEVFLGGCTKEEAAMTTATPTEEPAATSTPEPMPTNTPKPTYTLSGTIFFDYNGSGLQDVAYDMNGELIKEPAIPDVPICLDHNPYENGIDENNCTYSNEDGMYSFTDLINGNHTLYVISPSNEPAEAFRYVNIWKREVVINEYTKEIETATMDSLEAVEACKTDSEALVCKYDEDTLVVREQHLNDTEVKTIEDGIDIRVSGDIENNVAMMQGFLTLPFMQEQVGEMPFIWNYFDILGNYFYDDAGIHTSSWNQDGDILTYEGIKRNTQDDWRRVGAGELLTGVGDGHDGIDFLLPIGNCILSALPTGRVLWLSSESDPELRVSVGITDPENTNQLYENGGTHLSVQLVVPEMVIYRGQIIGLSGNSGSYNPPELAPKQNHFGLSHRIYGGWESIDPFRTIVIFDSLPENYWGSEYSYWTVDNFPFFGD